MKSEQQIKLFWAALIIGLAWSVYSSTAELLLQVERVKQTLFVCGNSWLIRSVM
jgi:hypothetical protein